MSRHRHSTKTAFLDILLNTLLGFIALFVLAFIQIRPDEQKEKTVETKGEFVIVVNWPDESDDDVDTYVMDPAGNIAYFSSREVGLMHLERDDLGARNDVVMSPDGQRILVRENEERVIIRGIVPGEYIVNVHMYAKRDSDPTPVRIALIKLEGADREIETREVTLEFNGDEKTVFRFTVNPDNSVTDVNDLPRRFTGGAAAMNSNREEE